MLQIKLPVLYFLSVSLYLDVETKIVSRMKMADAVFPSLHHYLSQYPP